MSSQINEINCSCGKLIVNNNQKEVLVEGTNQSKVSVDRMTFAKVLEEAFQPQGLIASDHKASAIDPQGFEVSVTVHHYPSDSRRSSWANISVDGCGAVQLDSLQISQLRSAL